MLFHLSIGGQVPRGNRSLFVRNINLSNSQSAHVKCTFNTPIYYRRRAPTPLGSANDCAFVGHLPCSRTAQIIEGTIIDRRHRGLFPSETTQIIDLNGTPLRQNAISTTPPCFFFTHLVSWGQHRTQKNERFHFFYPQNRENPFYVHGPIILCSQGCCLAQFSRRT